MKTPRINININSIKENVRRMKERCDKNGIKLTCVVKGVAGDIQVINSIVSLGVKSIADSRLENIIKIRESNIDAEIVLLRLPRLQEADNVVKYADVSLVSEVETIKALGSAAEKKAKEHGVILMVDTGDLREGIMPDDVKSFFKQVINIKGINIKGIGTNVGCYGGILPDYDNTKILVCLKNELEKEFSIELPIVSGGNTATTILLEEELPFGINSLRIGEGILLGTDVTNQRKIPYLINNNFTMTADIIELKNKPSVPKGKIGCDAFGNVPKFKNKGIRKRAILAIGRQDVIIEGLSPLDEKIEIIGASSDHLIVDLTESNKKYKVGDEISFNLDYGAMLSLMNSDYVYKNYQFN